jgi:hypothetical protein
MNERREGLKAEKDRGGGNPKSRLLKPSQWIMPSHYGFCVNIMKTRLFVFPH